MQLSQVVPEVACILSLTCAQAAAQDCDVLFQHSLWVSVCVYFALQDFKHGYNIQQVNF